MGISGCYGPFYLVRKVHKFNGEVSDNKWIVEVVYLLTAHLIPVYGIAGLADAIIFNSIEFWTGENPLAETASEGAPASRRIVRGDSEYRLTLAGQNGEELVIEQFVKGEPGPTLRLQRRGDGVVALDGEGATLFSSRTEADGRVVVSDAAGKQVASYSGEDAEKFLRAVRRY
jgi:hypothetical protein